MYRIFIPFLSPLYLSPLQWHCRLNERIDMHCLKLYTRINRIRNTSQCRTMLCSNHIMDEAK